MDLRRNRVENTNDCSIVSKYSMTRKKYGFDEYLKYFVSKSDESRSRSSLINRGYYIRFKAIEYAFNECFDLNQIISIGCGFDTSSLRFPNISFIEIDFPFVALTKAQVLIDNQLIKTNENHLIRNDFNHIDSNEPIIVLKTDNYCLIGADLRKYESIYEFFIKENLLKTVNKETKIGLFNECSLCYLKQDISDSIIKVFFDLYHKISHSITYIGFEQLKSSPNNGFSTVMLNHFETIGSPLMTFLSKSQLIHRFKTELNFDFVDVLDMKTFFDQYIDETEKQRINGLEMFDEFEEFDLLCNSYGLTIAKTNSKTNSRSNNSSINALNDNNFSHEIKPIDKSINKCQLLYRFGHTTCLTKDNEIVLFGGFGCDFDDKHNSNKKVHKRLSNLIKINTETDELINYKVKDNSNICERIHSKIVELEKDTFLICGGRRSPSVILGNQLIKLLPENSYETQSISEFGEIPPKVYRHLFLKLNQSNKMVELGGKQSSNNSQTNHYHILDTNTMQWQQRVITNISTNIYSHSGVSLNPYVMIINGGLNCDTNSYHSNDIYLIDDRIRVTNNINVKGLDHLYSHNIKCFDENKVLIIGGIAKSGTHNKIDLIDLRFNQIIDSMDIMTESSLMLLNFSSELIVRDKSSFLWLIGGGGNCFSFGTHFNKPSVIELFIK